MLSRVLRIGQRQEGLPPGPPTVPILGNAHIFPKAYAHYQFTEWARIYGDVYSLTLGSGVVIVLTSMEAIRELMDRRSASTADRPANYMSILITGGLNMTRARYSDTWRALRKAAHWVLTQQKCNKHLSIQCAESTQLMYDLLQTPERAWWHVRRYSNSVVLSVFYGKRAPRYETKETAAFFEITRLVNYLNEPGAHPPVDQIPLLRYVPERWAPWKLACRQLRRMQRDLYFDLLSESEARVQNGESGEITTFMDEIIRKSGELKVDREMQAFLGGNVIEGGSDTTSSFLHSFVLLLAAFPEAQHKAQEEMDRVVGPDRMPAPEDYRKLIYLQALIQEVHRFRPVAPLALPHASLSDEIYKGHIIPKGSTIYINVWGVYHDPELYDRPDEFIPERFLESEFGTKPGTDTSDFKPDLLFGAGRRVCPGIHLAQNTLMVNSMNLIWGFDFAPTVNKLTGEIEPLDLWAYHKGVVTDPRPFVCSIKPRTPQHASTIRRCFQEAIPSFAPYEERLSAEDKAWLVESRKDLF
ncbi:cytochrome P450 [Punctularia strigosozonata HHB-11173 SS5]|uniref:cytochrome P450 n=1 Tax=Punctularia strigosozonata (strain HHB-11173) TaxID=741275 RepID=UPI0004416475|nr:cytochrome P450 [Punctularia strigosozonata HHB-11173 SS5]EIN06276.1 cytochrome P450 [Punctularia strigosozonata HHB-11173 SS5]